VSNGELRRRAAELGVSVSYWDWQGDEVVVSDQTLAAIVAALETVPIKTVPPPDGVHRPPDAVAPPSDPPPAHAATPAYSPEAAAAVHGADWHPSPTPPENKAANE